MQRLTVFTMARAHNTHTHILEIIKAAPEGMQSITAEDVAPVGGCALFDWK